MSANLADHLLDTLQPYGAPSDDDIAALAADVTLVRSYVPSDLASADWVGRKAKRAVDAIAALQAQRDAIVGQADTWLAQERTRHDQTVQWATGVLEIYLRIEIAADDSKKPRKSRELPSGVTVKLTSGRQSLVVDDEDTLIAWALDNEPQLVKYSPKLADIKAALTADGLAVPGVSLVRGEDGFKLTVGGA